jgi:hypothetical protein
MNVFEQGSNCTMQYPTKQHYYYHNFHQEEDDQEELFNPGPITSLPYLFSPTSYSSSLPSDASFMSLSSVAHSSVKARKSDSSLKTRQTSSSSRRASTPSSFMTLSTKRRSCECKALDFIQLSPALILTYPIRFLKYGVNLDLQSHETIQKPHLMSSVLPSTWTGHTIYSFSCSLLLPDIRMYENDQPCSFQISKRYSEFRAFYLRLVCFFLNTRFRNAYSPILSNGLNSQPKYTALLDSLHRQYQIALRNCRNFLRLSHLMLRSTTRR